MFDIHIKCIYLEQCFVNHTTVEECSTGSCVLQMLDKENGKEPIIKQFCDKNFEYSAELSIIIHLNLTIKTRDIQYKFGCDYNKCNNEEVLMNLLNIVDKYHDISPMLEKFNFPTVPPVNRTRISSTVPSLSPISEHTTSKFRNKAIKI